MPLPDCDNDDKQSMRVPLAKLLPGIVKRVHVHIVLYAAKHQADLRNFHNDDLRLRDHDDHEPKAMRSTVHIWRAGKQRGHQFDRRASHRVVVR
jgi:hypothetical protein